MGKSWANMPESRSLPIPGKAKRFSMITVPPIMLPTWIPSRVIMEKQEGRRACRSSILQVGKPLARARSMKSSCRVAIMSLRSTRIKMTHSIKAMETAGSTNPRRLAHSPTVNEV